MKNDYCDLAREEIERLPEQVRGILMSPFQFTVEGGYVRVPEDTFKHMIELITNFAKAAMVEGSACDAMALTQAPQREPVAFDPMRGFHSGAVVPAQNLDDLHKAS